MYRYAVCNADNKVVNVIVWDGVSKWQPPAGHFVVRHDFCDVGHVYDPVANSFSYQDEPKGDE